MPTITKSIGTSSRDYSTITLWAADLDDGGIYTAGDTAIGEMYSDSDFDESFDVNKGDDIGGVGGLLAEVILTVNSAHRHDGTAGTGARLEGSTTRSCVISPQVGNHKITFSWLEIENATVLRGGGNITGLSKIHHLIIHHITVSTTGWAMLTTWGQQRLTHVYRNIIYRGNNTSSHGAATASGIAFECVNSTVYLCNNTLYYIRGNNANFATGIWTSNSTNYVVKNNVVADTDNTGAGTEENFKNISLTVVADNASSDSTSGDITSLVVGDTFVSTVDGSEDFHQIAGSDLIDGGTDLGLAVDEIHLDIDGRDLDTEADTWDIGADEYVAAGGGAVQTYQQTFMTMGIG